MSRQAQELLLEMRAATEELTHQLGRAPADGELAQRLGVIEDDIAAARRADLVFSAYSLDAPPSDREDAGQLADLLGEDDAGVERAIDIEAVHSHLENCPNVSSGSWPCGSGVTSPRPISAVAWESPRCTSPLAQPRAGSPPEPADQ